VTFGSTRTTRTAFGIGAALAVSASLLMLPGTAQAETALLPGTPLLKSLGITDQVRDMVVAGGKVWVSSANQVDVFSTSGAKLKTITGLLGSEDLIASADGTSVYVAVSQDARIATLNTTSMEQTASWVTSPCPTHLALAGGRLFYGFGCATLGGGIGSLSAADGSAGPTVAESLYYNPWLSGGGDTLVAMVQGITPATVNSYHANADGTVTDLATARLDTGGDFTLSPDGTLLLRSGDSSALRRYTTADLAVAGTFTMQNWSGAVAYSADGTHLAGTADSGYTGRDMFRVFDGSTGSLTSRSLGTVDSNNAFPDVRAGTLQFGAGSTLLYGITQQSGGVARLVTATTGAVSTGRITATVTSPKAYGQKVGVNVTAGRANTKVTVNTTANGTTSAVSKVSNAAGTVTIPVTAKYSGTLTVTLAGDLTHAATTTSARAFTVPAKLGFTVTGAYSTSGGLQHFHKGSAVKMWIRVSPNRRLTAKYALQAQIAGKWRTLNTVTQTAQGDNTNYFYLSSATKHIRYRFVGTFAGDRYNAKAPVATSRTIIID
jgi:hypothetical protein